VLISQFVVGPTLYVSYIRVTIRLSVRVLLGVGENFLANLL
jgi:hypothetical protein